MAAQYGRGEPVARGGATAPIAPARRIGFLAASSRHRLGDGVGRVGDHNRQ